MARELRVNSVPGLSGYEPMKYSFADLTWVDDVIHFWFDELGETRWFAKSHEIDAQIRDRFQTLHDELAGKRDLGKV